MHSYAYNSYVGGLCGFVDGGQFVAENCSNSASVVGNGATWVSDTFAGGLIGIIDDGSVDLKSCYNIGIVGSNGDYPYAGGLVASASSSYRSFLQNCFNAGRISAYWDGSPDPSSSTVTWFSSDETVATVDENGLIYGVNRGSATITCQADNNGVYRTCTVNVNIPSTEIAFDEPEVTMYVGDTRELTLTVNPGDTTDYISYSSSDRYDVSVTSSGTASCTINALYSGTETITATTPSGLRATCKVNVLPVPVIVTSVSLNTTSRSMLVGEMYKLNATVSPSNATDKTITWTSTDETVATVSDTGYITAVGAGETVITASATNGVVGHCTITVTDPANNKKAIIYISDVIVDGGDYFDIPVMLKNNPGINKAVFSVQYDKTKVEPVSVTNGEIFDYTTATTDKEESKVNLYFTADENKHSNGILATLNFRIIEDVSGSVEFKLCYTPSDFENSTQETVEFETEDGVAVISCSHKNTEIRNAMESTCTTNGYTGDKYCLDCKRVIVEGAVIPSIDHVSGNEWIVCLEPCCEYPGMEMIYCLECGETLEQRETPALGHIEEWITLVEETCTTGLLKIKYCTRCEEELEVFKTEALGHTPGVWVTVKDPDCTTAGFEVHQCSVCEEVYEEREIPKTAHNYKNGICNNCGEEAAITTYSDSTAVIDYENKLIYGLAAGVNIDTIFAEYISVSDEVHYEYAGNVVSTGNTILLYDNSTNELVDTYTFIIFGDVNGDGWYDGMDAVLVSCLANGMLTQDDVSEAVYMAADCNHDGVIDHLDVALLNQAGTLLATIDQSRSAEVLLETSSAYVEYISLVDQSPEIEVDDETGVDVETEDTPEQDEGKAETSIIEMIFNFIKSIIEMLPIFLPFIAIYLKSKKSLI